MKYGIGIVYGLGIKEDGTPEVHGHNKLLKLSELLNSREVERGILAGSKKEVELATDYFVDKLGAPKNRIYGDVGWSFVDHMYHIRKTVGRWLKNGEIPYDAALYHIVQTWAYSGDVKSRYFGPALYHIVQTWAVDRAAFDAGWIIRNCHSKVIGVEDGRPEDVVWEVDTSEEPRRMRTDRLASKVPILSTYRPDIAQLVASATDLSVIKNYSYRLFRI